MKIKDEYPCSVKLNNIFENEFYKMSRGFLQQEGDKSSDIMKNHIDQFGTELRKAILTSLAEESGISIVSIIL